MMKMNKMMLAALVVMMFGAASVSCQDASNCDNLDPSSLSMDNPSAIISLLPCTGWDQACQSTVMAAGASCIQEFQAIGQWLNSSGVMDQAEASTGISANATAGESTDEIANQTASIGADVTPDQAESMIKSQLPALKEALGGCCGGQVTPTCCAAMDPIISGGCLCQEKPVDLLKTFIGQDPANFIGIAAEVMNELGCAALNDAKVYPNCARRS
jgi:hypothetical protein